MTVTGAAGWELRFDAASGGLASWTDSTGQQLLAAPLSACFYRAPTDNDRGGSGGSSYAARWKAAGLDRLEVAPGCTLEFTVQPAGSVEVSSCFVVQPGELTDEYEPTVEEMVGVGEVGGAHWLSENQPTVVNVAAAVEGAGRTEGSIVCRATYTVNHDGSVLTQWEVDASDALPAMLAPGLLKSLPRVGLSLGVPGSLQQVQWYGRGPHECYPDRKAGAALRCHSAEAVAELHVPYVFPSESGGRADTRWLALSSGGGSRGGLLAAAVGNGHSMQMNVSAYSVRDFELARHEHDLQSSGFSWVHLDHRHMGLGGDDSWSPTVHEAYLVPPTRYSFGVLLCPLAAGGPSDVAAQATAAWRGML